MEPRPYPPKAFARTHQWLVTLGLVPAHGLHEVQPAQGRDVLARDAVGLHVHGFAADGLAPQGLWRPQRHQPALVEQGHVVAMLDLVDVLGGDYEEQRGVVDEGAGEFQAALHTAGEVARQAVARL